jgi:hypothetical protein
MVLGHGTIHSLSGYSEFYGLSAGLIKLSSDFQNATSSLIENISPLTAEYGPESRKSRKGPQLEIPFHGQKIVIEITAGRVPGGYGRITG